MTRRPVIEVRELVALLADRADAVCRELFPEGHHTAARCVVGSLAGERGRSLSVHLAGHKPGLWHDYATGEQGDVLDLVAQVLFRGDKARAIAWAKRFLGLDEGDPAAMRTARRNAEAARARAIKESQTRDRKFRAAAWRRWGVEATAELEGTPVDAYLAGRGIDIRRLPSTGSLRYHPELLDNETGELLPAMLAAIVAPGTGKFMAVHRTFLEVCPDGSVHKARIAAPKRVLGRFTGGHISINKGRAGTSLRRAPDGDAVLICEGIENGTTLTLACPDWRIISTISLSNMASVVLPVTVTTRVLFRDNDTNPQACAAFDKAVAAHQAQCPDVRVAAAPTGNDANEFLQQFRRQGVA